MALTDKQTIFVEEYLTCFNATHAALKAGYSPKSAYSIGHELLKKPEVAEAIQERLSTVAMSANEVLERLAQQARADYSDCIRPSGVVDVKRLVETGRSHLIKSIKFTESGKKNVEFYDAQAALIQLGKHHKLFTENVDVKGVGQIPIAVVQPGMLEKLLP